MSTTPITLTIFPDAETWLITNADDLATDRVAAVYPTSSFHPRGLTHYRDQETGKKYRCNMEAHVKALQLLCEQIGRTLFVGGIKSPYDLTDPGSWDVEVVDAYFQLVCLGEVVYG